MKFLRQLDASERPFCREARFLGRKATALILLFEETKMCIDLSIQIWFRAPRTVRIEQSQDESPDGSHVRLRSAAACQRDRRAVASVQSVSQVRAHRLWSGRSTSLRDCL